MTEEQIKILREAIHVRFFASSPSKLASILKIQGKMIFSRLVNGNIGFRAAQRLWDDLCYGFNIPSEHLMCFSKIWALSNKMTEVISKDDFSNLVLHKNFKQYPSEISNALRNIYKDNPILYCYTLALFYAKTHNYDPNFMKGSAALIETLQQVDCLLIKAFPEALYAHKVAADSIAIAKDIKQESWCSLMMQVGRVICYYTHPLALENQKALDFSPLPFDNKDTFWISKDFNENEATIWALVQIEEDSGIYNVLYINAEYNKSIDPEKCTAQRWGFFAEYDSMRCGIVSGNIIDHSSYYDIQLKENNGQYILCSSFRKDLSSPKPLLIPNELFKINKDDLWMNWVERESDNIYDILFKQVIENIGFEETDLDVIDITMSRNACILITRHQENGIFTHKFEFDKYPSLKKITVWDEVCVFRGKADGELYAYWTDLGLCIKLLNTNPTLLEC